MDSGVFFGALLGAFFGFLSGLGVDYLSTLRGRHERRRQYARHMATDLRRNLLNLAEILRVIEEDRARGFTNVRTVYDRPSSDLLDVIASSPDALLSLPALDQAQLLQLAARLKRFTREYDSWPEAVASGSRQVVNRSGRSVLLSQLATDQLLDFIEHLITTHMALLINVLDAARNKDLPADLKAFRASLEPTRGKFRRRQCKVAYRPPPGSDVPNDRTVAVVWTGGSSSYDGPLVELSAILESNPKEREA